MIAAELENLVGTSKALGSIVAALSLARIVAINLVAVAVALVAAVHVYNRQENPRPAPIARGVLAAHPTPSGAAPSASGAGPAPWLPIDVELLDDDAPGGSVRAPASPGVNDASRR